MMLVEVVAIGLASLIWLCLTVVGMYFAVRLKCESIVRRFCFACICTMPVFWTMGLLSGGYIQFAGGSARLGNGGRQFTLVSHGVVKQVSESTWRRVLFLEAICDTSYFWMSTSLSVIVFVPRFLTKPDRNSSAVLPDPSNSETS